MAIDAGNVTLDVKPDVSGFATELKAKLKPALSGVERDMNNMGPSASIRSRLLGFLDNAGSKFSQLDRTIKGVGGSSAGLGNAFSLIKWPVIISAVDVLASGIGALAAGAVQLVAGLAPLTGMLVLYPAIAGAVGQAFGVVKLAFSGVATAAKLAKTGGDQYKNALMALSPVQRTFVKQLVDVKAQLTTLKDIASGELLPGLGAAMQRLTTAYLPAVQNAVRLTATELSTLAGKFTDLFTSGGFVADLTNISQNNVTLLGNLGTAALGFADGLRHVVAEAQPFVLWMGNIIQTIGTNFAAKMLELRTSGSLAAFFDTTKSSATALGTILSNVGHTIFNVLQIAQPLGQTMLDSFGMATQGWQNFTESIAGRSQIFDFFTAAQPTLHSTALLIRDIVSAFFELAKSPGFSGVIDAIRTQLLPFLVSIGQTVSGALLPALVDLGSQFLEIFQVLGSETPILIGFVKIITGVVKTILNVIDTIPGLKTFIVTILVLTKVLGILGIGTLVKTIAQFKAFAAVTNTAKIASGEMTAAQVAMNGATSATGSILATVSAGFHYFIDSIKNVAKGILGIGTTVTNTTSKFSAFGQSLASAALGGVAIGVALGFIARAALQAADRIVTANTKIAETTGNMLVNTKALFSLTAAQFRTIAAQADAAAGSVSFVDDLMGASASHVSVYTATWETLERLVLQGKIGLNEAAHGFTTVGLSADQSRVELEKLSIQMFNTGKITRDQLVTRLLSLGFTYEQATGRANALNVTLQHQSGVIAGITQKVKVFTFDSMTAFREWGTTVKTSFRSFVDGATKFKTAFNISTRQMIQNMKVQVQVARQGALDMAKLGDLAIPPGFKKWLIDQGPASIRAFVSGNAEQQGVMQQSWKTTQNFVDKYGNAVDRLPKTVKTTARFDARAATAAVNAYRSRLVGLDTTTTVPHHGPVWTPPAPIPGLGTGGIVTRPMNAIIGESGPEAVIPLDKIRRGSDRIEIVDSNLDLIMTGVVRDEADYHGRRDRANR